MEVYRDLKNWNVSQKTLSLSFEGRPTMGDEILDAKRALYRAVLKRLEFAALIHHEPDPHEDLGVGA